MPHQINMLRQSEKDPRGLGNLLFMPESQFCMDILRKIILENPWGLMQ
jgi:hypothetical protein